MDKGWDSVLIDLVYMFVLYCIGKLGWSESMSVSVYNGQVKCNVKYK